MYIGGHVRRCYPFTTWSRTLLAPHFMKLITSYSTAGLSLFLVLMGYCATEEVHLLLALHEMQNKVHMRQDEP